MPDIREKTYVRGKGYILDILGGREIPGDEKSAVSSFACINRGRSNRFALAELLARQSAQLHEFHEERGYSTATSQRMANLGYAEAIDVINRWKSE